MQIRRAQWQELPQVLSLCKAFFDQTEWPKFATFDPSAMDKTIIGLMSDPTCNLIVAVDGETVAAMVGIQIAPYYFGRDRIATELFWYVREDYRGHKVSGPLFLEAEAWAKKAGARSMVMGALVSSPPHVREMYARAGYSESQTAFIKEL